MAIRNKKFVFIGDSITRYQYLNFVYFLERGRFPEPFCTDEKLGQSICCQNSAVEGGSSKDDSWNAFFRFTNKGLNGNEICDCSRNKQFNLENRVYHNKELNTVVAFFWLGRDLSINLRDGMFNLPLQPACTLVSSLAEPSDKKACTNTAYVSSQFSNVTLIGDALISITRAFEPDVILMNWGHHSTYVWQSGPGRQQYESITQAVKVSRAEGHRGLLYWKTTTPIYTCDSSSLFSPFSGRLSGSKENDDGGEGDEEAGCGLKIMKENDGQNPTNLGNKLVQDRTLEVFDAQQHVKLLYAELRRRRRSKRLRGRSSDEKGNSTDRGCPPSSRGGDGSHVCGTNPLGWDSLHYYCWVNTELNRALIANYVLKRRNH